MPAFEDEPLPLLESPYGGHYELLSLMLADIARKADAGLDTLDWVASLAAHRAEKARAPHDQREGHAPTVGCERISILPNDDVFPRVDEDRRRPRSDDTDMRRLDDLAVGLDACFGALR